MTEQTRHEIFKRAVRLTLDGMDNIRVDHDLPYASSDDAERALDLYRPAQSSSAPPVVIIVSGYPGPYRRVGWTMSMCRLLAVSGLAAIAYTSREPIADIAAVFEYIARQGDRLGVDGDRIGVLATSGNGPVALSTLARRFQWHPACAAFECAATLDLDGATEVSAAAAQFGFSNPMANGSTIDDLRQDVPILMVRAGLDEFVAMNASIDRFVSRALARNMPLTLLNYPSGIHAFSLFDDSRPAKNATLSLLRFFQAELLTE